MTSCCHRKSHLVLNARKSVSRPSRADPTLTLAIRNAFIKEIRRRFNNLKLKVFEYLYRKDTLSLRPNERKLVINDEFEFLTDTAKLAVFNSWLQEQINLEILFAILGSGVISTSITSGIISSGTGIGFGGSMGRGPWTMKYIESSYKKGLINAYLSARRNLPATDPQFIDQAQEDFLRNAFLAPERISKVQLLASRSFEYLKGVSAQMSAQMNSILAQGMIDGKSVLQITREMVRKIDGLTESRALTIARTEIIHAHAEGQLDSFEDLGVRKIGVLAEWSTAGDDRVCPICAKLEGKVFTIEKARGKIPQHPNCRCTWIPFIPTPKTK